MKLVYKNDYLSIKKFNNITLPNLTVLTGLNGSGKTHLLQAIQRKDIIIEGLEEENPIYFDYKTFFLENESEFNAYQIFSERESAWNYFLQQLQNPIQSYKNSLGESYSHIVDVCKKQTRGILSLSKEEIGDNTIFDHYKEYRKNIKNLFENNASFQNNDQAKSIYVLLKTLKYSIDLIEKDEFLDKYKQYNFKNDFLPSQLGKIIWDYYVKWDDNKYKEFENRVKSKNHKVFTDKEFFKLNGQKPWVLINQILSKFNSLKYKVNDPEEPKLGRNETFKLKLINTRNKSTEVDFNSLSSGEKVLMALVASIYKVSSDKYFPKILLLDEIDASLHPSMIQNLLEVIEEIFLNIDTNVILVTHSPTTIAIAPPKSVYIMKPAGVNRIVKKDKQEALSLLTEGFATLDEGIKLFDQISKKKLSIITEGKNTEYLRKALNYFCSDIETDIEIISGVEGSSGKEQLKVLFDFFSKVPHEKIVVFVWDNDAIKNLISSKKTVPYFLDKNNKNQKVSNGIENLFDEKHFLKRFYLEKSGTDGGKHQYLDKEKFLKYILEKGTKTDFQNFEPLFNKIKSLLKTS